MSSFIGALPIVLAALRNAGSTIQVRGTDIVTAPIAVPEGGKKGLRLLQQEMMTDVAIGSKAGFPGISTFGWCPDPEVRPNLPLRF